MMGATMAQGGIEVAFQEHQRSLWGLVYRLTGNAADADEVVQETFTRALSNPPADTSRPWKPWLIRVATNLGIDRLRARQKQGYKGPWLPSPVPTGEDAGPASVEVQLADGTSTEGRYGLLESVSFAFLLALETLKPRHRAVLLLRDVFDYPVRETAEALEMSEANVKTTLHRARAAMESYDADRFIPDKPRGERIRQALQQLMMALLSEDVAAVEKLLAEDVRHYSDGGGEYLAAGKPVAGRDLVLRLFTTLAKHRGGVKAAEVVDINGAPAFVMEFAVTREREAPRMVLRADLNEAGEVVASYAVLASRKLTQVRFPSEA